MDLGGKIKDEMIKRPASDRNDRRPPDRNDRF